MYGLLVLTDSVSCLTLDKLSVKNIETTKIGAESSFPPSLPVSCLLKGYNYHSEPLFWPQLGFQRSS